MPNDAPAAAPQPPTKPPEIIATLADQRMGPDRVASLALEAERTGKPFKMERAETALEKAWRQQAENASLPTVSAADTRSFLANLQRIAAGDVRVTD